MSAGFGVAASLASALATTSPGGLRNAAVTVVCGILFRGERLFWWQVVGLCGTVSAVGLIVTG